MVRISSALALLGCSLSFGPAFTALPVVLAATGLVACQDESQPDYWVEKLEDPQYKARAIKRLEQFFEDAVTTAGKDMSKPEVTGLLDKIVQPLTTTYVDSYGDLDEKSRVALIKLIAAFRDQRGAPAITKAFDEFGQRGRGAEDVRWAARAAGDMKLEAAAAPMLQAFGKLRASSKEAATVYRDLNEAMVLVANSSWTPELVSKLEVEITRPGQTESKPEKIEEYRNQLFWQTTSAQVLGEIGDASAVEPLLKVLLDPAKVDVHSTAVLALVKIGPAAVQRAVKLLKDEDKELADYAGVRTKKATGAQEAPKDKPHVRMAAIILGTIGDKSAADAMVAAARDTKEEENKAVIAGNLAKLPPTPEVVAAFKEAFESLSDDAAVSGQSARVWLLSDPATQFLDPGLIPWVLEQAQDAKGEDKDDLQHSATLAAIKLMTPKELGQVRSAVGRYGSELEKTAFKQAADLLNACKTDINCYLSEIQKTSSQAPNTQFVGIKAGYMLGILGDSKTPAEIVKIMKSLENAAVRFVAVQSIDRLLPNGSKEVADQMDAIVQGNIKAADRDMMAADTPVRDVVYRLRSRGK